MAQLRAWLTIAHGAGAHTTRAEGSRVRQRAGRSLRSPGIRGGLRAEARTRRRGSLAGPVHNLEGSAHQETQPADSRSRSMTSEFQPNNKEAIKARPGLPGAARGVRAVRRSPEDGECPVPEHHDEQADGAQAVYVGLPGGAFVRGHSRILARQRILAWHEPNRGPPTTARHLQAKAACPSDRRGGVVAGGGYHTGQPSTTGLGISRVWNRHHSLPDHARILVRPEVKRNRTGPAVFAAGRRRRPSRGGCAGTA